MSSDVTQLRDLTKQYLAICGQDDQAQLRERWRQHNSLDFTSPLIYVRAFAWNEMAESKLTCEDPFWHPYESFLRMSLFRHRFQDDFIFEPWINVNAIYHTPVPQGNWEWGGLWGLPVEWIGSDEDQGSHAWNAPLKDPSDFQRMQSTPHRINEAATAIALNKVEDALGDLMTINLDRGPAYRMWHADISTELIQLRGLEQVMLDMMDRPAWLHDVLSFMRDSILAAHQQAEANGDWTLCDHQNQAIPYAQELRDPHANSTRVQRNELWTFCAAQELTLVSPQQFDEFMLQYQIPIIEHFGLCAYGCCEDLSRKIDLLRKIPNLRRIAVSPFADVAACAEQIGNDYVISYRPSPTDMVSYGLDEHKVRQILQQDMAALKGTCFDITLKDVETVQKDPQRISRWVELVRQSIEDCL